MDSTKTRVNVGRRAYLAQKQREWYARNKAKRAVYDRIKYLRKPCCGKSITIGVYQTLSAIQNGLCAICKKAPKEGKRLYMDHCHITGEVRGLLCPGCNTWLERKVALGFEPEILYMANPPALGLNIPLVKVSCDNDRHGGVEQRSLSALEMRRSRKGLAGSNPVPSADRTNVQIAVHEMSTKAA